LRSRKTLPPIRPNEGLKAQYRRCLEKLVDELHYSVITNIALAYKSRESEITRDASPAIYLQEVIRKLANRWLKHFQNVADTLADHFTRKTLSLVDGTMQAHLKDIGMAVPFKMTREMNNTLQSVIGDQVGLIKSIPEQYLREVEGLVMRSVSAGRDLKTLSDEIQARYGVTKQRAKLIATDQNNKAHAMIERGRQEELGITKAIWHHSHGGRKPRPEHVAFDGHEYDVKEGAFLEGKFVWPGTEINCRCFCTPVIPTMGEK